jgi:hypothetical protein
LFAPNCLSSALLPRSIKTAVTNIRGWIKMRLADSLFKNRPGSSEIIMIRRAGFENLAATLSNSGGIASRKSILIDGTAVARFAMSHALSQSLYDQE